jgi:hypothetical protein
MVDKPIFELGREPGIPVNVNLPTLGIFLCAGPTEPPGKEEKSNQIAELNFTGRPGTASQIYQSLVFQLPKWGWFVEKADEWIEVSPTHKEYYDRTVATKQMLESTIKTGLTSAAQAVADFELMSHDLRRYKEILRYFEEKDEHSLKAMFIDQVDVHTDLPGQPMSLRSAAVRWPTIIADFMKLTDKDIQPDDIAKKFDISKAEAVILATKNRLYQKWKDMFGKAVRERYQLLLGLVKSRKKSIDEYRRWLKPYIARFKMTKLGTEESKIRAKLLRLPYEPSGVAAFANGIRLFVWKPLKTVEFRKPAAEVRGEFIINPYDDYVKENFILDPVKGLASIYPWLRNERKYCPKCKFYQSAGNIECEKCGSTNLMSKTVADEIVENEILPAWKRREMGLDPFELYYDFLDIDIVRIGFRIQTGELEDITFTCRNYTISQNILLVKILELKCRDKELEKYIDEMLGIRFEEKDISELLREEFPSIFGEEKEVSELKKFVKGLRDVKKSYSDFFKGLKLPKIRSFMFVKPGPYERDFKDRIPKNYLSPAGELFNSVVKFLKQKMGVG